MRTGDASRDGEAADVHAADHVVLRAPKTVQPSGDEQTRAAQTANEQTAAERAEKEQREKWRHKQKERKTKNDGAPQGSQVKSVAAQCLTGKRRDAALRHSTQDPPHTHAQTPALGRNQSGAPARSAAKLDPVAFHAVHEANGSHRHQMRLVAEFELSGVAVRV